MLIGLILIGLPRRNSNGCGAIRSLVSIVHASTCICSRIGYCNSLYAGLPKTRLSSIQSVMNSAAMLIARLTSLSHISTYVTEFLHWLPVASRIRYKVLFLIAGSWYKIYVSASWCENLYLLSSRPLRSADSLDPLATVVSQTRTAPTQNRAYASVGPSMWNDLTSNSQ